MSVPRDLTLRVLKRVLAAEPEPDPVEKGKGDTQIAPPPLQTQARGIEVIGRLFFYLAPRGKKIDFKHLYSVLSGEDKSFKQNDKRELINNLKGSTPPAPPYAANYFKWVALMVKAQERANPNNTVVYTYTLGPAGEYDSANVDVTKKQGSTYDFPTPDEFARNNNLFTTKDGVNTVSLSQGIDTQFTESSPSSQIAERFLDAIPANAAPETYGNLNDVVPFYRMWVVGVGSSGEGGELRLPDGTAASEDELGPNPGDRGQYPGGSRAFQALMEKTGNTGQMQQEPSEAPDIPGVDQESLGEKKQDQVPKNTPVDEQKPTSEREVKEQTITQSRFASETHSGLKATDSTPLGTTGRHPFGLEQGRLTEINKGDPKVNEYIGESGTMVRDLARRQHNDMKIWKGASEETDKEGFIKEINEDDPNVNQYEGDWSIMQDLVRRQHKKMKVRKEAQTLQLNVPAKSKPMKDTGKALEQMGDAMEEAEQAAKAVGVDIKSVPGATAKYASMVDRVVNRFLGD